jgi:hypothetical protein
MTPYPWNAVRKSTGISDNDYLRKHYATTGIAELKKILHRADTAITKQANKLGLRKALTQAQLVATLVLESAAKPDGFHSSQVPELDNKFVGNVCQRLMRKGLVIGVDIRHKHVRYFTDQVMADAYRRKHRPGSVTIGVRIHSRSKVGWGPDDPMHCTAKTKYTIAPAPPRCLRTNTYA